MRPVSSGLAEMRSSGRTCMEELRSRIWRISLLPPSGSKSSCKWKTTTAVRFFGHHARTGSILIMTTDGFLKAARFPKMNEESSRRNVDNWNALRGLPWDVTETGAPSATTSNHPSAFDATSALCHKGRLEEMRCDDRLLGVFGHSCSREDIKTSHGTMMDKDWRANGARF